MAFRPSVLILTLLLGLDLAGADDLPGKADAMLQEALASKNPDTRKLAVVALSLAAVRAPYQSRLTGMLHDKDAEVRLAAVSSLSDVKSNTVAAELRKALEDDVPEVSFAAAKALWTRRDPAGKRALMAVLEGESKATSSFLSRQKREALRMMHTPRTALLFAARQGAGFAPIPGLGGGISSMQAILTDPEVSGRAAAALLLAQRTDQSTLSALQEALSDKDASLRAAAVHALALTNNAGFKKSIGRLLDDEKETVRLRAAAAYLRLSAVEGRTASPKAPARTPGTSSAEPATR